MKLIRFLRIPALHWRCPTGHSLILCPVVPVPASSPSLSCLLVLVTLGVSTDYRTRLRLDSGLWASSTA